MLTKLLVGTHLSPSQSIQTHTISQMGRCRWNRALELNPTVSNQSEYAVCPVFRYLKISVCRCASGKWRECNETSFTKRKCRHWCEAVQVFGRRIIGRARHIYRVEELQQASAIQRLKNTLTTKVPNSTKHTYTHTHQIRSEEQGQLQQMEARFDLVTAHPENDVIHVFLLRGLGVCI